jgi:hypothetical protein
MFSLSLANSSSSTSDYTTGRKHSGWIKNMSLTAKNNLIAALVVAIALMTNACSALQPTSASGPRASGPAYPLLVLDETARQQESSLAWRQLAQRYGFPNIEADLQPVTATLHSLPANMNVPIFLPRVGIGPNLTEEDTRESLRRFLTDWRVLIGADPAQLSLVERTDEATGNKIARYRQRPFRNPLRGPYGNLIIRFDGNHRLLDLSSTCLPNTERLQTALAAITPKITAEDVLTLVKGRPLTLPDATGRLQNFTILVSDPLNVRQMVVYGLPPKDQSTAVELRLAWEIELQNGPFKTIYLDAVDGEVIAGA